MLRLIGELQPESWYWSFTCKRVDNYIRGRKVPEIEKLTILKEGRLESVAVFSGSILRIAAMRKVFGRTVRFHLAVSSTLRVDHPLPAPLFTLQMS